MTKKATLLLLLSFLWGTAYPLTKAYAAEIPKMIYLLGRTAIGALILRLILSFKGRHLQEWTQIWIHL